MPERKGQETRDNIALDRQAEDEGEEGRTEENECEPLKDIIESDLAVEPDAKVVEELKMLPKEEECSEKEKMVIAYAIYKRQLVGHTISKIQHQRRQRQRR